jgi:hypothetical protein
MKNRPARVLGFMSIAAAVVLTGCASSPAVRLTVSPAQLVHLNPGVIEPPTATHDAALHDLDQNAEHARERVARAQAELAKASADTATAWPDVREAKLERARAEVAWQQRLLDGLAWRRADADATFELAKATILGRTGVDIDLDAYREQASRVRHAILADERGQVAARTRFEQAEQHLNAVKARHAQTAVASSVAPATP